MSKPTPPAPSNPWDPAAWKVCAPSKVTRDPDARRGDEVVRAPNDDEIRRLQQRVPEAAGKCLFVLEREPGVEGPLPWLPTGKTLDEVKVLLNNIGYVASVLEASEVRQGEGERVPRESSVLLLYERFKLSMKSARSWKDIALWESEIDSSLTVLTTWGTLEGTKEFGRIDSQLRPDPGFRAECPTELTYLGDPATAPPLILPHSGPTLYGFYPRRLATVGPISALHQELVQRFPRFQSECYWVTGVNENSNLTSLGFCLARVLDDPSLMNKLVDPEVFKQPPWASVPDPPALSPDAPLVALFPGGEEAPPHGALRSKWQAAGEVLWESKVDLTIASEEHNLLTVVAATGIPIVSSLRALEGGPAGSVSGYYTLAP